METQAVGLSPIENLYSDYISYKHKAELVDELKSLYEKMTQERAISERLLNLDSIIEKTTSAISTSSTLREIAKYKSQYASYHEAKVKAKQYSDLVTSHEKSIAIIQSLAAIKRLLTLKQQNDCVSNNVIILNESIESANKILHNEFLISDLIKQLKLVSALRKCSAITDILNSTNDGIITQVDDLMYVAEKLTSLSDVNISIKNVKRKCTLTHNKLAKFGVCPLCGNHLEIHEESVEE